MAREHRRNPNNANKKSKRCDPIVCFTGLLAIFTLGLVYVGYQTNETLKATLAVQRLDTRAWIGVPEIKAEKISKDSVKFVFLFKNVGHTPTHGLWIDADIVSKDPIVKMRKLCGDGEKVADTNPDYFLWSSIPDNIFPISNMPSHNFGMVSMDEVIGDRQIVGCVVYTDRIDNSRHHTGFMAPVSVNDGNVSTSFIWAIDAN